MSLVSPFFGTRCTLLSNSEKVTRQDNSRASSFGHSPVLSAEHFSLCGFLPWTADRMMLREREGCCKNGMARKGRGRTLRSRCGSWCNEAIAWTCGPQSQRGHYADRQRERCRRPSDPLLGIIHRQIAASHAQYTPLALRMVSNNAELTAVKAVSNSYSLI